MPHFQIQGLRTNLSAVIMWSIVSTAHILEIKNQSKKNNLKAAPENIQKLSSLNHAQSLVGEPASVKLHHHHPPNLGPQEVNFDLGQLLLGKKLNKLVTSRQEQSSMLAVLAKNMVYLF